MKWLKNVCYQFIILIISITNTEADKLNKLTPPTSCHQRKIIVIIIFSHRPTENICITPITTLWLE